MGEGTIDYKSYLDPKLYDHFASYAKLKLFIAFLLVGCKLNFSNNNFNL